MRPGKRYRKRIAAKKGHLNSIRIFIKIFFSSVRLHTPVIFRGKRYNDAIPDTLTAILFILASFLGKCLFPVFPKRFFPGSFFFGRLYFSNDDIHNSLSLHFSSFFKFSAYLDQYFSVLSENLDIFYNIICFYRFNFQDRQQS
jgi:hypothetical protein